MNSQHTDTLEPGTSTVELAKRFAEAKIAYQEKSAEAQSIHKELAALEEALVKSLEADGIGDLSVETREGRLRLYTRSETWVRIDPAMKGEVFEALKAAGHGDLVQEQVNANTLRAWYREQTENGTLPGSVRDMLTVQTSTKIGTRSV